MKKNTLVIFLVLVFTFNCAFSESNQFVFRDGIKFGDSLEDIKSKEKTSFDYSPLADGGYEIIYNGLTLSGIGNSSISYFIHANCLTSIEINYNYLLVGEHSLTVKEKDYQTIEYGLSRKYPVQSDDDVENMFLNTDSKLWAYVNTSDLQSIIHAAQRLIPLTEHETLVIQHMLAQYTFGNETRYTHRLTYHIIDPTIDAQQIIDQDL